MFKKLPGDEARSLVSTTSDTAVVFRPAVMHTPVIVTIAIWLGRLITGLARTVIRHPVATAIPVGFGVIWIAYGWSMALVVLGVLPAAGLSWLLLDRASFLRLVVWPLLAWCRSPGVVG